MGWLPQIPTRLLADSMTARVPDGEGFADAGSGRVYIDAVNSVGGFLVPVGSRVGIDGVDCIVWRSRACEGYGGRVHHWEVDVR